MRKLLVIAIIGLGAGLATEQFTIEDLQEVALSSGGLVAIGGFTALVLLMWTFGSRPGG